MEEAAGMSLSYLWGILFISLHAMVPITLTAVGEIFGETAGLFNIGLEGILLVSAFTGALAAESGGAVIGLLAGMGTGAIIGFIFSVINTYWKGNQMITGIGINLFALGFVAFGLIVLGAPGFHAVPAESRLVTIRTPVGSLSPIILVALVLPFVAHWFLKQTRVGLILKATGESPEAADVAGIRVNLVRLLATTFGGVLAGLAGAYISVAWIGSVTKEISAGRGFIALATVVFSGLNPVLALLGGFIFGFFESLATWVRNLPGSKAVPWQFIAMTPYIVTLLVVAGVIGRVRFPKALGKPYIRE
jgi:simple sugar transport system permease protein